MLFENLMFLNVSAIQSSFLISGSDASPGPAYVSPVQVCDAPMKPSKIVVSALGVREGFLYSLLSPDEQRSDCDEDDARGQECEVVG